jgi:cellobiose-specific phosphotransferase system component IIC
MSSGWRRLSLVRSAGVRSGLATIALISAVVIGWAIAAEANRPALTASATSIALGFIVLPSS